MKGNWELPFLKLSTLLLPGRTSWNLVVFFVLLFSIRTGMPLMCVQCDTGSGDEDCQLNPPPAENCTLCMQPDPEDPSKCLHHIQYDYCMIVRTMDENGTLLTVSRSCSPFGGKYSCQPGTHKPTNTPVTLCHSFCNTDGCNTAPCVMPAFFNLVLLGVILIAFSHRRH